MVFSDFLCELSRRFKRIKVTLDLHMKKLQIWLPLLLAVVLIIGMRIGYQLHENVPASKGIFSLGNRSAVQEVIDLINAKYVDPLNTDTISDDAIEALLLHLDPHSVYIPARSLASVNEDLQGNFEGIGVEFHIIKDTVHVITVMEDGPSDVAGLLPGDRFLTVGDSLVAGNSISADRIKKLLRGERNSQVAVTILRDGAKKAVTIKRGTIPLYSVDAAYMMDAQTGYIHLNKFSGTTYEEFMQAMEKLQEQGMTRLIFDLRNNGGGILGEAVDIIDEFLDGNKLIVYTEGDKLKKQEFRCKRPGLFEEGELVVLVDEGSASASEVVAGALQDWDRATVIGRRTFGKGLVQEQYSLSGGSALRLTVARYYTPTGRSIQKSYENGRMNYLGEVHDRLQNGEMIYPDSVTVNKGKAFRTKGGRTVYGGGGITPDIHVPLDTSGFTGNVGPIFDNQHFSKFIYAYYLANKSYFNQFTSPDEFADKYVPDEAAWNALVAYLDAEGVNYDPVSPNDKEELKKRIKSWMARQLWRLQGYYQVVNRNDQTIRTAFDKAFGQPVLQKK